MSIGTGVVLFVIGAILSFALNLEVSWVDLRLVGYILMVAGAIIFIVGLVLMTRRRRSVATSRTAVDPANGDRISTRSSESDDTQL